MAVTVQESRLMTLQAELASKQLENTLSKREQFAMAAMQGLLSGGSVQDADSITAKSYQIPDLMISEGSGKDA